MRIRRSSNPCARRLGTLGTSGIGRGGGWGPLCFEGVGAYCSAMPAKNYNSFPEAPEVLVRESGEAVLIRKRQTLSQILENEVLING